MAEPSTEDTLAGPGGGDDEREFDDSHAATVAGEAPARRTPERVQPLGEPDHIGRHLVIKRLGAGAMGVVYAAYDPELDRKLAIKLIRAGRKRDESQERMVREAQAMAKLSHPNVIAIYDVGTWSDQVYIAMEFVDGRSLGDILHELPDTERDWQQILELFTQAGKGLAAAHAAGLVHRDFKPDNVLVGSDQRVRVLDFGLARATEGAEPSPAREDALELEADTISETDSAGSSTTRPGRSRLSEEMTRAGSLVGTPAYMPPEHLAGHRTDARGDQFSFCVALWEGLYAERPFAGETMPELFAAIVNHRIREAPAKSRAQVPDWLHAAIVRGLSHEPEQRWPDMPALLQALEPPPVHTRKRAVVAMTALAAVLFGLGTWAFFTHGEDSKCSGFESHLDQVWDEPRRETLRETFAASEREYAERSAELVIATLDSWTTGWLSMREDACKATHVSGEQSEELLDLRMACLDRRLARLDALVEVLVSSDDAVLEQAAQAVAGLESLAACADAEALRGRVGPPSDPMLAHQVTLLDGELDTLEALHAAGRYKDGRDRVDELAAKIDALGWAPLSGRLAYLHGRMANALAEREDALAALGVALARGVELGDGRLIASAAVELVWAMRNDHESRAQLPLWEQLASAQIARLGDPLLEARLNTAMGDALWEQAKHDDALARYERALALREAELGPDHLLVTASRNDLAHVLQSKGELERAREILTDVRARYLDELGPAHPWLARVDNEIGAFEWKAGNYELALEHYERALSIRERAVGKDNPTLAGLLGNIGATYGMRKNYDAAIPYLERALALRRKSGDSAALASNIDNLAAALARLDRWAEARELYREAYEVRKRVLTPEHPDLARSLINMAQLELQLDNLDDARQMLEQAVALREQLEVDQMYRARARWMLAVAMFQMGETKGVQELVALARKDYEIAGVEGPELQQFEEAAERIRKGKRGSKRKTPHK